MGDTSTTADSPAGVRLLYVEDNDDNAYMLARRLRRRGFDVLLARDGAAGIDMAHTESPDLILMDLSLPVVDGWTAAGRLKTDIATRNIPILGVSSHAMAVDRSRALAAGCDDFDTKPVEFERLLRKIVALLTGANAATSADDGGTGDG